MFVTGRGGAGFHSQGPALTRGRGGYFSGDPRPAPARGPPALIPWTGPHLLPPIFNRDPSGVWVGRGPEWGQGQGMPKKTPCPRPLSGAGRGKGPGARLFRGPVRPVTNSRDITSFRATSSFPKTTLCCRAGWPEWRFFTAGAYQPQGVGPNTSFWPPKGIE